MKCPSCKYRFDAHEPIGQDAHEVPETGDVTVCINCGGILEFIDPKTLVKASKATLKELRESKSPVFDIQFQIVADRTAW